jgi:hypothetical protein
VTLAEWREAYPDACVQSQIDRGAVQVFYADLPLESREKLFRLDDYLVSSAVSGPSYIMVRR